MRPRGQALARLSHSVIRLFGYSIFSLLPCSLLSADFSGSATVPGGGQVSFTGVAATNWVNGELVLKYTTTTGSRGFTLPGPAIADALVVGGAGGFVETNDMIFADGTYAGLSFMINSKIDEEVTYA